MPNLTNVYAHIHAPEIEATRIEEFTDGVVVIRVGDLTLFFDSPADLAGWLETVQEKLADATTR